MTLASLWLSPKHERVHDLLRRLIGSGAAQFFADACEISQRRPPYRTATHIIGHLVREVESAVRQVLRTLPDARARLPTKRAKGDERHGEEIDAVVTALGLSDVVRLAWHTFAGRAGLHRTAHRDDLRLPRALGPDFAQDFDRFVDVLARVLDAAEANYDGILRSISDLKKKPRPDSGDADTLAIHLAPGAIALAHVFDTLSSEWLAPLRERSVFSQPPGAEQHEDGAISLPSWPQAFYLERIASKEPKEVADTILATPVVDNASIHRAFLAAAMRMPASEATKVAMHEAPWLAKHPWNNGLLSKTVEDLAIYLVASGGLDAGLALAHTVLDLSSDGSDLSSPRPTSGISSWEYERFLGLLLEELGKKSADAGKDLLIELLDAGMPAASSRWRSAIEDSRQNGHPDAMDSVLVALRRYFESAIATQAVLLPEIVTALESKRGKIYDRLALHLLGKFGGAAEETLIVERLTDRARLEDNEQYHELTMLLRSQLEHLPVSAVEQVISAIKSDAAERYPPSEDERATEDQLKSLADGRLLRWLAAMGDARPPLLETEYRELCAKHGGEPDEPTFLSWIGEVQTGPNAPLKAVELAALTDDELLDYLRIWSPQEEGDLFAPSRSGLGRQLQSCSATDVPRFCRLAKRFQGLHPEYAGALLMGLHQALQNLRGKVDAIGSPDLDSVVSLADWVSQQRLGTGNDKETSDWAWARRMAAAVLELVACWFFADDESRIRRAWAILLPLLADDDPRQERTARLLRGDDTAALNSVRGRTLDAVLSIAAVSCEKHPDLAREMLAGAIARLDPSIESVETVRNVFAQHWNNISIVSNDAAASVARALFPTADMHDEKRWRSFGAFLWRNSPHGSLFPLLREHFQAAVANLRDYDLKTAAELGEHVILYAAWGVLDQDPDTKIISGFVATAPVEARHKALNLVARNLRHESGPLSPDAVDQVKRLWDWWSELAAQTSDPSDLASFGWWFTSDVFDEPWLLSRLMRTLELTKGRLDWDDEVAEKLEALVASSPEQVMDCLERFALTALDARLLRCGPTIKKLLVRLLEIPATTVRAKQLASRLAARGSRPFEDLLS